MKIHHTHHGIVLMLAVLVALILLLLPKATHADTCNVGDVCKIIGSGYVQVPVTSKQDPHYI